ncbi:MarR family winged helix-turn-helix transcriptional regulator [Kineothrix sp. MB12-C1]|uniref:MarR family winged helix-turn-helix transcriptional regulator n=1 Tax=Kineothrix sp. MB12-C1 TaxID=3070215 RepID=UPI0027D30EE8|nr:winged helix DNA-binding protein [Kineothrix sp. MB12-C1]WMC93973.1 winged helix DNA-binding protein [Kineothrix sp. MB12-C1]
MDNDFETLLNGQQFKRLYEKMSNLITERYGLHKIEIEILIFLRNGKYDTARDIAENKFFSKAHISQAIEHLTERGYIRGQADEQDRRCIHLHLTKEAQPVCEELLKLRQRLADIMYQDITEEEKQIMLKVAQKIASNINRELGTF